MGEKQGNAGRPSSYKDEYAELAYRIIKSGNTNKSTAYILGITQQTYYNWIKTKPYFRIKIEKAKEELEIFLMRDDVRGTSCCYDGHDAMKKRENRNKNRSENSKNKRMIDINYRLRTNMSSNIGERLRNLNIKQTGKFRHLDYTVEELKEHLEKQFTKGMNWSNYGDWHVDHIKPASLFKYTSVEDKEFKECWALSNLQPLWAFDNLSKGNKWDG